MTTNNLQKLLSKVNQQNNNGLVRTTQTSNNLSLSNLNNNPKLRSPSTATKKYGNFYEITFQIADVLSYGVHDPSNKTKPMGSVSVNPQIHPNVLTGLQTFTGWIRFKFLILSQSKDNPSLLIPNETGGFVGQSTVLPFAAPYVTYKAKIRPKKQNPGKQPAWSNNKSTTVEYSVFEVIDYTIYPAEKLSETMLWFILQHELKIKHERIPMIQTYCANYIRGKGTSSFECYDITKLKTSIHASHKEIWDIYTKKSAHAIGQEFQMVLLWFSLNLKQVNVYDMETVQILRDVYKHCISNSVKVYFEVDTNFGHQLIPNSTTNVNDDNSSSPSIRVSLVKNLFGGDKDLIQSSVRKEPFLRSLKTISGMEDECQKIKEYDKALEDIRQQIGQDTIFYNFQSIHILQSLAQLIEIGIVKRISKSLAFQESPLVQKLNTLPVSKSTTIRSFEPSVEHRLIHYYKLSQNEHWTRMILDGIKHIIIKNRRFRIIHEKYTSDDEIIVANLSEEILNSCAGELPDSYNINIIKVKPFDNTDLNPDQVKAYDMIIKEKRPLVCIYGPPGTGKTKLIHRLFSFYQMNKIEHLFFASSYVNAASVRLNCMGIPTGAICATYNAWKNKSSKIVNQLFQIQIMVIEEFSNVSEETASMYMELIIGACPNLTQLVFIFDQHQIKPIGCGNPAINFLNVLGKMGSTVPFQINHRILQHSECENLVNNGTQYRDFDPSQGEGFTFLSTEVTSLKNLPERGCFHLKAEWNANLAILYQETPLVNLLLDFQAISFKNVNVNSMNEIIDSIIMTRLSQWLNQYYSADQLGRLNHTRIPSPPKIELSTFSYHRNSTSIRLYPGKRVIFTENTNVSKEYENVTFHQIQIQNDNGSLQLMNSTVPKITFADVNNGEFGVIRNIYHFYSGSCIMIDYRLSQLIKERNQIPFKVVLELFNPNFDLSTGFPPKHVDLVSSLTTHSFSKNEKKTKFIILDNSFIPFYAIRSGWAVTVDKYQGAQSKNIILLIQKNDAMCFTKEHGLVSITRVEDRMVILGVKDELNRMALNNNSIRSVDLEWRMENMIHEANCVNLDDTT